MQCECIINVLLQRLNYLGEPISFRSNPLQVFLGKDVLKIYSKFTGEHPYRSLVSVKLLHFATLLKSHFDMGALL